MQRLIKNPVYMVQDILKNVVEKGDTVVDATCGNGYDTVFLARLVGEEGKDTLLMFNRNHRNNKRPFAENGLWKTSSLSTKGISTWIDL